MIGTHNRAPTNEPDDGAERQNAHLPEGRDARDEQREQAGDGGGHRQVTGCGRSSARPRGGPRAGDRRPPRRARDEVDGVVDGEPEARCGKREHDAVDAAATVRRHLPRGACRRAGAGKATSRSRGFLKKTRKMAMIASAVVRVLRWMSSFTICGVGARTGASRWAGPRRVARRSRACGWPLRPRPWCGPRRRRRTDCPWRGPPRASSDRPATGTGRSKRRGFERPGAEPRPCSDAASSPGGRARRNDLVRCPEARAAPRGSRRGPGRAPRVRCSLGGRARVEDEPARHQRLHEVELGGRLGLEAGVGEAAARQEESRRAPEPRARARWRGPRPRGPRAGCRRW